jgi:hypothetical protein
MCSAAALGLLWWLYRRPYDALVRQRGKREPV